MSARRLLVRPLVLALSLAACVLAGAGAQPVTAAPLNTFSPAVTAAGNPLTGPWGRQLTQADIVYRAYLNTSGTSKALLGKIALQPRMQWFGTWNTTGQVASRIQEYIRVTQAGNPKALVQLAAFRLWPNGGEPAKMRPLTVADQAAYRAWVREAARGIGSSRVAMVLEPDLGVALKGWQPDVRLALTNYAARVFGALPRTSVYLDASDADWLRVDKAVAMLRSAGVAYVRGFALGATHYWSVTGQKAYGHTVIAKLAAAGIPNRHFVIDTADNGRPFTYGQYYLAHPHGRFDNAETCTTRTQTRCITLGPRPTWQTGDAGVDAYLWFGRPWLTRQARPFDLPRALAVARTTPY